MTDRELLQQSLEALKKLNSWIENWSPEFIYDPEWPADCAAAKEATTALLERLAQPEQEPVADALHLSQWTAAKKDLPDYIYVGSLTLAGIEDGEYGQSEIDSFENTIEALQANLVTGSEHKKVPLLAYIGGLNTTPPAAAQPQRTEQEPVAHLWECLGRWSAYLANNGKQADCAPPSWLVKAIRNATTPPAAQRKPLTDGEIQAIHDTYYRRMGPQEFARAIESAHGIK